MNSFLFNIHEGFRLIALNNNNNNDNIARVGNSINNNNNDNVRVANSINNSNNMYSNSNNISSILTTGYKQKQPQYEFISYISQQFCSEFCHLAML